jgi:pimeloyl-ACP methyl ester carboxylesterase
MTQPTLVLVHGAWGGAWVWDTFVDELTRRGVSSIVVDLPSSHSPEDATVDLRRDADAVLEAARGSGPVVLVGHSYGGSVITEAASRVADLVGLVYVAALVPLIGQSSTAAAREVRVRTTLDEATRLEAGMLRLDPALAGDALYNECPPDVALERIARLGTQTLASFAATRTSDSADALSLYVRCTRDQAIDPAVQEVMARRCTTSTDLDTDHSPMTSRTSDLADLVLGLPTPATSE